MPSHSIPSLREGTPETASRGGVPRRSPAPSTPLLRRVDVAVAEPFDDRLPEPVPLPRPKGWIEVFCCGGMVLALVAVIIVIALVH